MLALGATILVLGTIIFFHESGHFLVAKLFGVSVKVFSIGFGKRLAGVNIGGTDCRISLIPLGGYVQLEGEDAQENAQDPKSFSNLPRILRILVYAAGPAMNFILTIAVLTVLFMQPHRVPVGEPVIKSVEAGTPAEKAGLRENDRLVSVDTTRIKTVQDFQLAIQGNREHAVAVIRDGERAEIRLTPVMSEEKKLYTVGVTLWQDAKEQKLGFRDALSAGITVTKDITNSTLVVIGKLIDRDISMEHTMGPVGIAQAPGKAAEDAGWAGVLSLIAVLSINIGILNLFPIIPLDGGFMFFLFAEMCAGKDVPVQVKNFISLAGIGALLLLTLVSTYYDILRAFLG